VSQGFGLLGRELEALANRLGAAEIEDEGEDLDLRAAEGAQERIDLVVLAALRLRGVSRCRFAALAARGVGVETPVANHLSRLERS